VFCISGIYTVGGPLGEDWKNQIFRSVYASPTFGKCEKKWREASPMEFLTCAYFFLEFLSRIAFFG
jgi:hypothetical protein